MHHIFNNHCRLAKVSLFSLFNRFLFVGAERIIVPGMNNFYPLQFHSLKVNENVWSWEKVNSVGINQECANSWDSRVFFYKITMND